MSNLFWHRTQNGIIECNCNTEGITFLEVGVFDDDSTAVHNEFVFLDKTEVRQLRDYLTSILEANNEKIY